MENSILTSLPNEERARFEFLKATLEAYFQDDANHTDKMIEPLKFLREICESQVVCESRDLCAKIDRLIANASQPQ